MDGLMLVVALIVLAIPVSIVILFFGQMGLRRRLGEAASEIRALRAQINVLHEGGEALKAPSERPAETENPASADMTPPPVPVRTSAAEAVTQPRTPGAAPPASAARPGPVAQALAAFVPWLQRNWFYAVSAASLALAGIFLVQYGVETGLLPPRARVAAALVFGAALIGAGEFIRRRFGDGAQAATVYLPSVFSGAGIVTLFGAVLSARLLYGLVGGGASMAGVVVIALVAIVLGWLHGPLLVAVGVIGAYGAPVVLDSASADTSPLLVYFAVVAALGLGVDTIRRWGWISALTLVLAYVMGSLLMHDLPSQSMWAAVVYFAVLPVMAVLFPARGLWPDHQGPMASIGAVSRLASGAKARGLEWPQFPTVMAFASVAASAFVLALFHAGQTAEIWLSIAALGGLAGLLTLWSVRAPALQDQALMPAAALLVSVWAQGAGRGDVFRRFAATYVDAPEAAFPWTVTILVAGGGVLSALAVWRSLKGGQVAVPWAVFAAVFAPAMAIMIELGWQPAVVIDPYPWALHAVALAVLMVGAAGRFADVDGPVRLRVSFAVMSALACLAFAFVIVLSDVALTVALAVTVLTAAALDRRWTLPPLSYFIAVGVVTLGYRLVIDPGLEFGRFGPLAGMLLAYGGTLAAFAAALWLLRPLRRPLSLLMLESAAWSTAGMTISLLIFRWIDQRFGGGHIETHWSMGLFATIWLGLALAQVYRTAGATGLLQKVRWILAGVFGLVAASAMTVGLTEANPLLHGAQTQHVLGPWGINTLAAAYLLPALVLLLGAWRMRSMDRQLRMALAGAGVALAAFWAALVIRHFWQGGDAMQLSAGITQPELYTYTIALLLVGAVLFYQALARGSAILRRAGLLVIGLAVAKVFMVDIPGLEGLVRVFSLLVLGLSLAALAWLDRWAQQRTEATPPGSAPPPLPPATD